MRLHDLRPAEGSRKERTRVGRGIAAGKGKTAGRGTKGQKARAGGSIPAWFEGGQTPLHQRIPKLRGFKNRFKIEFEIVNVGDIEAAVQRGAFEAEAADAKPTGKTKAPAELTVNQDILRAVGLVRSLDKPLKILGSGDLSAALFVVADGFSASARSKIEAAGGTVNVLEVPTAPLKAIGVESTDERTPAKLSRGGQAASDKADRARAARAETAEAAEAEAATKAPAETKAKGKSRASEAEAEAPSAAAADSTDSEAEAPSATASETKADTEAPAATATEAPGAEAKAPNATTATDAGSDAQAESTATPKPRRAARTKAAATDDKPSTETASDPETATAATDEAETASGDDA
jgi:large subunit ribosomal protein L15